jgi:diguanylate cyclase (GGDEF)-like protein/PAS domain S-box-containing protein
MAKAQILVVEDDNIVAMELRNRLQELGYTVAAVVAYGEEAIEKAGEKRPDAVLMDIRLRGAMDGIEAAEQIRSCFDIPVIYLTAYADENTLQRAKTTEPYGYVMKPFETRELYAVIEMALHKHKLETALRESEEKYRRVVEQSSDGIVLVDERGAIIDWNRAAEQITGLKRAEVLGHPLWDIQFQVVPEEQRSPAMYEQMKTRALDLLRTGQSPWLHQLEEVEMQRLDGTCRTIQTSGFVIPTDQGFGAGSVIRDITDRKRAEEALRESEAKYRQLVEYAPAAIYEVDMTSGKFLSVNDVMCEYLGYSREELLTMDTFSLVADESGKQLVTERWAKMLAGEAVPETAEYKISRKDGGEIWGLVNARLRYEDGVPAVAEAVAYDITERKRAEEVLQRREEHFRSLIENALDVIMIVKEDGTILYTSPSIKRVLGYQPEELNGESVFNFIHPDDVSNTTSTFTHIIQNPSTPIRAESRVRHKDGSWHMLEAVNNNLLDDPVVAGIVTNFRDITERKQAEKALRERVKELTCLYAVNRDMQEQLSIDELCKRAVQHLARAMQFPEIAVPVIELVDRRFTSNRYTEGVSHGLHAEIRVEGKARGCLWVYYAEGKPFLIPEEQNFVNSVAEALGLWLERQQAEEALRESEEKFRTFTESAPVATMIYQAYQCVYANPEAEQITGYSHQELQQMKFWDFLHPDYRHIAIEGGKAMERGEPPLYKAEFKIITKNGDEKWSDGRLAVIEYEGRRATVISLTDITDRKRAEEEIRQRTAQLEALRQIGLELTAQLDLDALLRSIASRAIELVGGDSGGLYLYRPEWDVLKWAMAVGPVVAPIGSVLRRGEGLSGKVLQTGEPIVVDDYQAWEGRAVIYEGYPFKSVVGVPVRWGEEFLGVLNVVADLPCAFSSPDIELLGLFATQAAIAIRNARLYEEAQREIAERMRAEEIIQQMAYHDDLTGLPNRRLLNDRLTLELAHAHRNRQKLAMMLLDLDHFKEVNDTLGHSVGDKLLQAVGDRLTGLLRKGDTVARMGGDEFMLLLPGITRLEDVDKTAQKILEAFRRSVEFDSHEIHITTSIGITLYPDDGEDSDTLMKNADIAMYRAKGGGRDNYQRYTSNEL